MKARGAWGAFLLLVILAALAWVFLNPQETIYVNKYDISKEIFNDLTEKIIFVTLAKEGINAGLKIFVLTSYEEKRVSGQESLVYEYLVKNGIEAKDIAVIIHNHFSPASFSERDNKTHRYFQDRGFKGFFCIYYPALNKVRCKGDETN